MQLDGLSCVDPVLINLVQFFEHRLRFVGRKLVDRIIVDDCHFQYVSSVMLKENVPASLLSAETRWPGVTL